MRRDLYAEVSAKIIAELERGAAPWVKPWSVTPCTLASTLNPNEIGSFSTRTQRRSGVYHARVSSGFCLGGAEHQAYLDGRPHHWSVPA